MSKHPRILFLAIPALILLASCATAPGPTTRTVPHTTTNRIIPTVPTDASSGGEGASGEARLYKGTGQLVKGQLPGGGLPPAPAGVAPAAGQAITLNFEGADLRDVVRSILGDTLGESYTIDPTVGGAVTIRTTSGIPREALYATLETLLRSAGATMVKEGTLWKIIPAANAVRGNLTPQLGNAARALPPGYSVQIVPLRYMGVRQMATLLEPFAREPQTTIRADDMRNLLILSGTELELKHLLEAVDMFDVNWIGGMSVGLFTLKSADVKSVMTELDRALGADPARNPLAGIMRIVPIERLNALLVITPQAQYLDEAKKWIDRLDRSGDEGTGVRFYVYNVQNSRAEHIAPLLQQAFTGRVQQQVPPAVPSVAPATPAGTIVSPPSFGTPSTTPPIANPTPNPAQTAASNAANAAAAVSAATARPVGGEGSGVVRNIQAVADKDNNTILFVATPAEYAVIESALKKLDVASRQVVIELTIAEVSLVDELTYGVEWLFKGAAPSGRGSGGYFIPGLAGSKPFNPAVPATDVGLSIASGFSYLINNLNFPGGIQAALRLLDTYGKTKVIANPHVAALDNQKATIKVGNRLPISQQTIVGGTTNAVTATSQYIDTGVLLQVTPHINSGGLVTLDVNAEVSNALPSGSADPTIAPPIATRSVQTLLSVPNGETMVMGGLITEEKDANSAGLPLISRIPVFGGLFGSQDLKNNRTELVLFITPKVVDDANDVRRIIDDLRRKMERLEDVFPASKNAPDKPVQP